MQGLPKFKKFPAQSLLCNKIISLVLRPTALHTWALVGNWLFHLGGSGGVHSTQPGRWDKSRYWLALSNCLHVDFWNLPPFPFLVSSSSEVGTSPSWIFTWVNCLHLEISSTFLKGLALSCLLHPLVHLKQFLWAFLMSCTLALCSQTSFEGRLSCKVSLVSTCKSLPFLNSTSSFRSVPFHANSFCTAVLRAGRRSYTSRPALSFSLADNVSSFCLYGSCQISQGTVFHHVVEPLRTSKCFATELHISCWAQLGKQFSNAASSSSSKS